MVFDTHAIPLGLKANPRKQQKVYAEVSGGPPPPPPLPHPASKQFCNDPNTSGSVHGAGVQ